jgi:hypothetical protein
VSESELVGDEAAVGVAEDDHVLVAEVAGELGDGDGFDGGATGASVVAMAEVDELEGVGEGSRVR